MQEKYGYNSSLNFTTREPRNEKELDDYVFLSKEQFLYKMEKGDFAEYTFYNGNWYGVSKFISPKSVLIMEPC